jgi:hypothetical protein
MAAPETEDERAVVAAAREYFQWYFDVNAARLGAALHPELATRSSGRWIRSPTR